MKSYLVTVWFNDKDGELHLKLVHINAPDTMYARNNAWISVLDEYGCGCEFVESSVSRI
jgi:hypothetical protein